MIQSAFLQKTLPVLHNLLIIVLVLILAIQLSLTVNAEQDGDEELTSIINQECPDYKITEMNKLATDFYELLDSTLKTADSNVVSLEYLFNQYQKTIREFNSIPNIPPLQFVQRIRHRGDIKILDCSTRAKTLKENVRSAFLRTYSEVASMKRGLVLFEKYDSVNNQLQDLQEDLRNITSDLSKFNDLLPCFVSSCVRK